MNPSGEIRPAPGHPRDDVIEAAMREMIPFVNDWRERHTLTTIEFLYVLGVMEHRTVNALCLAEREHIRAKEKR